MTTKTITITTIHIVNAGNTDGYALLSDWSDGSQGNTRRWFGSYDAAEAAAVEEADEQVADGNPRPAIQDSTEDRE